MIDSRLKELFVILLMTGATILNTIYTPITIFMYFLLFPLGSIISIIEAIITATIIPLVHVIIKSTTLFFPFVTCTSGYY